MFAIPVVRLWPAGLRRRRRPWRLRLRLLHPGSGVQGGEPGHGDGGGGAGGLRDGEARNYACS